MTKMPEGSILQCTLCPPIGEPEKIAQKVWETIYDSSFTLKGTINRSNEEDAEWLIIFIAEDPHPVARKTVRLLVKKLKEELKFPTIIGGKIWPKKYWTLIPEPYRRFIEKVIDSYAREYNAPF